MDDQIEDTPGEIASIVGNVYKNQVRHIEEFAAAYFQKTRLDPTAAKLVSRQTLTGTGIKLEYWFEPFPSGSEIEIYRTRAEAAERELAELRERTRWIPVSERLPDIGVSVLVIGKNVVCGIARHVNLRLYSHDCKGWHTPVGICLPGTVTHWMPLPEPPESA